MFFALSNQGQELSESSFSWQGEVRNGNLPTFVFVKSFAGMRDFCYSEDIIESG